MTMCDGRKVVEQSHWLCDASEDQWGKEKSPHKGEWIHKWTDKRIRCRFECLAVVVVDAATFALYANLSFLLLVGDMFARASVKETLFSRYARLMSYMWVRLERLHIGFSTYLYMWNRRALFRPVEEESKNIFWRGISMRSVWATEWCPSNDLIGCSHPSISSPETIPRAQSLLVLEWDHSVLPLRRIRSIHQIDARVTTRSSRIQLRKAFI